jgi:tetratricopeptide (TPR) repeat protein
LTWFFFVPRLCLGTLLRRPRQLLIVLGIGALGLAVASPFLWAGYHWYAGQSALQRYRHAEARDHLNACLQIWPWSRSIGTHLLAARAAWRDGEFLEAFGRLEEVQTVLGDQSEDALFEWALVHAASGDVEKVEGYLQKQAANDPDHALLILEALAQGYMRVSRVLEALQCVEEWLRRDPDNVQALYLRGSIYQQNGSWTKAAPDFRRVVERDPDRHGARWWLAG